MINELGPMVCKWFHMGVQLGLSVSELHQIESDHHTADRRFSEVINFWLKGNTQVAVTWQSLIKALGSSSINEKGLAKRLSEKNGLEPDKGTVSMTGQMAYTHLAAFQLCIVSSNLHWVGPARINCFTHSEGAQSTDQSAEEVKTSGAEVTSSHSIQGSITLHL